MHGVGALHHSLVLVAVACHNPYDCAWTQCNVVKTEDGNTTHYVIAVWGSPITTACKPSPTPDFMRDRAASIGNLSLTPHAQQTRGHWSWFRTRRIILLGYQ